jgi:hypothetical protein
VQALESIREDHECTQARVANVQAHELIAAAQYQRGCHRIHVLETKRKVKVRLEKGMPAAVHELMAWFMFGHVKRLKEGCAWWTGHAYE